MSLVETIVRLLQQVKKSQKNQKKLSHPTARSGRFVEGPSADAARFSESVSFDRRLWRQDIQGSLAHARMLQSIGFLNRKELSGIVRELKQIGREISEDRFPWKMELEDV
ncbi:MAG TPA: hypothetical protein EYG38_20405, partial [Verrucomicrobia bacterium]|nr:hypothetical protein [Verrucomicrobiota bacterium]